MKTEKKEKEKQGEAYSQPCFLKWTTYLVNYP